MLEKSLKKIEFDAHFHLSLAINNENQRFIAGCTCAHSVEEWIKQKEFSSNNAYIKKAFGLHPQIVADNNVDLQKLKAFLENLVNNNQLDAIGEMGFDFFTENFKNCKEKQEEIFNYQLEMAIKYNLPIIIHCRKANEKLFEYGKELKKLPGVLFHSFMGMPNEALALLKRGINAYFSFGKQLMNNNKKVIACVTTLPLNCLLAETDAPFQTLKGENQTYLSDIKKVYKVFADFRSISEEEIYLQFEQNFINLFSLR